MEFKNDKIIYNGYEFYTVEVALPKTSLLLIGNDKGFVMCGALDVDVYNTPKILPRKCICANAIGVRSIQDLFEADINNSTIAAQEIGIIKGIKVKDALMLMV